MNELLNEHQLIPVLFAEMLLAHVGRLLLPVFSSKTHNEPYYM